MSLDSDAEYHRLTRTTLEHVVEANPTMGEGGGRAPEDIPGYAPLAAARIPSIQARARVLSGLFAGDNFLGPCGHIGIDGRLDSAPAGRRKWRHRHRPSCRGHYRNRTPPASTHRWASSGSGSGATGVEIAEGFAPPSGRSVDPPVELIDHAESGEAAGRRQRPTSVNRALVGDHDPSDRGSRKLAMPWWSIPAMVEAGRISRI
jgi:hypothetical protein